MNICLILFMISITGSHCQYFSNRDIILTPHQLKTHPGKVLYYRPREQVPSDEKPKRDRRQCLQQQSSGSTENAPLLANRQQKAIYNAPYIGAVDLTVPRFGDIVELAHGRLEQDAAADDSYFFVQQQDGKPEEPQRNVTALWKVERIRHRDDQRGHRYELKFTVAQPSKQATTTASESTATPLEGEQEQGGAAASNSNRTYIIRDEDYPRYFGQLINSPNAIPMHRKNDQMFDRTFFDMVQSQAPPHPQPHHQFGSFAPATRFYRPAVVQQAQQTMTVGQYLLQSLLSGGEAPKYHHHHHHFVPGKMAASPAYYGGLAAATSNRINTSTTTIKPIPSVTSSVFDSNRIDGRSFEQQERKAEEMVMTTATAKNASNEKIKRDTSEATDDNKEETDRTTVAVAEQLVAQQAEHKQDALEVTEPEKEFVMVKANISPPIATNQSNMVLFEASDAGSFDASSGPAAVESSGRSIGSAFDDLTMSIINHAKAIVNQTEKPADPTQEGLSATEPTVAPAVASGKSIESNEIAHKDEYEPETTVEVTTAAAGSTSSPVTESTVSETIGTTFEDGVEGATADDGASQTTVAVDVA
uniref:Uncharacterized protein n=1 Tax=Anopheles coluzzii TaxID=1518534 RepID=A0A8W7PLF2_ANOCL